MQSCPRSFCFAPEATCKNGEADYRECPFWRDGAEDESDDALDDHAYAGESANVLPWSGNTMGTADVEFVANKRRPRLIGLVGPHNAGKTTLLAMVYLLLRRGHFPAAGRFAGSYSLGGWEQLSSYFEWKADTGPEYPPHTAATDGRRPGLLHLSFRDDNGMGGDTLWTDSPGEWFRKWATYRDDPAAAGARWTSEHSDVFLLFADSAALAGERRGSACSNLELLVERLGERLNGRKVSLVWTKSDIEVAEPIRQRVETACARCFPELEVFRVRTPQKSLPNTPLIREFVRLIDWVLKPEEYRGEQLVLRVCAPRDPLLAFRGRAA